MLKALERLVPGRGSRLTGRGPRVAGLLWIGKTVVIAGVGALVACGPVGPIPGGALSGEPGPALVADWSAAADVDHAQLETRPDDPHSVNTWFAAIGPRLYVPTSMIRGPKHPEERGWVAHVAADPRVRVRLGATVYERRAVRVEDPAEYATARAALEARYGIAPEERDPERTIWIYRLDARGE